MVTPTVLPQRHDLQKKESIRVIHPCKNESREGIPASLRWVSLSIYSLSGDTLTKMFRTDGCCCCSETDALSREKHQTFYISEVISHVHYSVCVMDGSGPVTSPAPSWRTPYCTHHSHETRQRRGNKRIQTLDNMTHLFTSQAGEIFIIQDIYLQMIYTRDKSDGHVKAILFPICFLPSVS